MVRMWFLLLAYFLNTNFVLADTPSDKLYRAISLKYLVPTELLVAISTHESCRVIDGKCVPWPYTLRYQSRAYHFDNINDARQHLTSALAKGITNIDIGLAQINYHWHKDKIIDNPLELLDPTNNLAVAAIILRDIYAKTNNWRLAVMRYHSYRKKQGAVYNSKIYNNLLKDIHIQW